MTDVCLVYLFPLSLVYSLQTKRPSSSSRTRGVVVPPRFATGLLWPHSHALTGVPPINSRGGFRFRWLPPRITCLVRGPAAFWKSH